MIEAKEYIIKGTKLTCKHCSSDKFTCRSALLNSFGMSLMNLDYLDSSAQVYTCSNCGFLHWFYSDVNYDPNDLSDESTCLQCDSIIPANEERCQSCGWSYND